MLFFSSFAKIKYTGPAIALSLAVALAASLTLAPALLALLRRGDLLAVPRAAPAADADRELGEPDEVPVTGFWVQVADLVVRHPVAILTVCLIVPAPPGGRGLPDPVELQPARRPRPRPAQRDRLRGHPALLRRRRAQSGHGPRRRSRARFPLASAAGPRSRRSADDSGRSTTSPRSARSPSRSASRSADPDKGFLAQFGDELLRRGAESRYVSVKPTDPADLDHITRFDIVFKTDPFSEASLDTLEQVRQVVGEATAPGTSLWKGPGRSAWPARPRWSTT